MEDVGDAGKRPGDLAAGGGAGDAEGADAARARRAGDAGRAGDGGHAMPARRTADAGDTGGREAGGREAGGSGGREAGGSGGVESGGSRAGGAAPDGPGPGDADASGPGRGCGSAGGAPVAVDGDAGSAAGGGRAAGTAEGAGGRPRAGAAGAHEGASAPAAAEARTGTGTGPSTGTGTGTETGAKPRAGAEPRAGAGQKAGAEASAGHASPSVPGHANTPAAGHATAPGAGAEAGNAAGAPTLTEAKAGARGRTGSGAGAGIGARAGIGDGDGAGGDGGSAAEVATGALAGVSAGRRGAVVAALMLAMALAALDATVVSTAVPQIVDDLGGFAVFSWLFSGYLLAVTVTLPLYGKLSDTFGRKPVLVVGAALFLLGSLLCALAWNMGALIAFRIVQGLGGGALQGTVQTLAADLYPLEERPRIQARLSSVWAVSAVAGPAVGGLLVTYADWRWIFLVNLPVGAVALWLIVRHLREPQREVRERPRVDWAGALAVFACGGALLTALVQGGVAWAWTSGPSLALFGAGLVLAVVVVLVERRAAEPIIPGWVWRRRPIPAVNLALGALGLVMIAPTEFLPTYAQAVLGLGPVAAGFVLSVWTLSWPVAAALSQHVYRRIGFRDTAVLGIGLAALLLAAFPLLPYPGAVWQPVVVMLLLGAALGLFQLPLLVGVQSSVVWAERGTATASVLFCRQTGQTVGAALFGAVANGVLAARLGGAGDLDGVTHSLESGGGTEELRRAVADAVHAVYFGAAGAAALAVVVLLTLAPRRFPVLAADGSRAEGG